MQKGQTFKVDQLLNQTADLQTNEAQEDIKDEPILFNEEVVQKMPRNSQPEPPVYLMTA